MGRIALAGSLPNKRRLHCNGRSPANNTLVVLAPTKKGLLWFRFVDSRTVFQLSPMGKLQVKWGDLNEKRTLYKLVKNLLIATPNEKIVIKPLKQQLWIEYPVPESLKLYWCDTTTELVLKTQPENKTDDFKPSKTSGGKPVNAGASRSEKSKRGVRPIDVKNALEELRREFRFFLEPTSNEVALKSDRLDSITLKIGLTLGFWKNQTPQEAKDVAEKAINLTGWLKIRESGELNIQLVALSNEAVNAASLEVIRRAQHI